MRSNSEAIETHHNVVSLGAAALSHSHAKQVISDKMADTIRARYEIAVCIDYGLPSAMMPAINEDACAPTKNNVVNQVEPGLLLM